MSFKYACFISYRHRKDEQEAVEKLAKALRSELRKLLTEDDLVWMDKDFIKIGDSLDESIGTSICESVCMFVFYTPTTFEYDHTWCAREYVAMTELEQARLEALGDVLLPKQPLIRPIVFRGKKRLLRELCVRSPIPFESVIGDLTTSAAFATEIPKIAESISDWCDLFHEKGVAARSGGACSEFRLPKGNDKRVTQILDEARAAGAKFPGRR